MCKINLDEYDDFVVGEADNIFDSSGAPATDLNSLDLATVPVNEKGL